jgi:two-component system, NarL family, response regulator LiaR
VKQSRPVRVVIVDDHAMVRSGLSAFLTVFNDVELVGEAASGEEALDVCARLQPDVVLMDLVMPGMDGVAATCSIREQCPKTQVIVLTSFGELARVRSALEAGAISYLLKNVSADELASAIRGAAAGQISLSPEAARAVIPAAADNRIASTDLTETERRVLALMVDGQSNPQIADSLGTSLSTVKFHVSNILSKLGVSSRTEAVAHALRQHLVT